MNMEQVQRMRQGKGFIAALDQSGGSTPKALAGYGIEKDQYKDEKEMFDLVHAMRTRVMTSPAFSSDHILAAILFQQTMERESGRVAYGRLSVAEKRNHPHSESGQRSCGRKRTGYSS